MNPKEHLKRILSHLRAVDDEILAAIAQVEKTRDRKGEDYLHALRDTRAEALSHFQDKGELLWAPADVVREEYKKVIEGLKEREIDQTQTLPEAMSISSSRGQQRHKVTYIEKTDTLEVCCPCGTMHSHEVPDFDQRLPCPTCKGGVDVEWVGGGRYKKPEPAPRDFRDRFITRLGEQVKEDVEEQLINPAKEEPFTSMRLKGVADLVKEAADRGDLPSVPFQGGVMVQATPEQMKRLQEGRATGFSMGGRVQEKEETPPVPMENLDWAAVRKALPYLKSIARLAGQTVSAATFNGETMQALANLYHALQGIEPLPAACCGDLPKMERPGENRRQPWRLSCPCEESVTVVHGDCTRTEAVLYWNEHAERWEG